MSWTRRGLLFAGGSLVALVGSVGVVGLQGGRLVQPSRPLLVLDAASFSTLSAVAETLCPAQPGQPSAAEVHVAEDVDAFLASCHPGVGAEVTQALWVVENALSSLLLDGRLRTPFSRCDASTRLEVLEAFRDSSLGTRRTIYKALLGLVAATYYGNPVLAGLTGYAPQDWTGTP